MPIRYKEINPSLWRRGQSWDYDEKDYIIRRTGAGMYLAFGIVEEAFQTGFTAYSMNIDDDSSIDDETIDNPSMNNDDNIDDTIDDTSNDTSDSETVNTDDDTRKEEDKAIHPMNDDITQDKFLKDHHYGLFQAIGHARSFEWSVAFVMEKQDTGEKVVVWGDKSNTIIQYYNDGVTVKKIGFSPLKQVHEVGQSEYIFEGKDLENCRVIRKRAMTFGEAEAEIDPYLDSLFALATLFEMVGLWSIRSIGVPIFSGDESLFDKENANFKTEIMDMMKNYGVNTRLLYPSTIQGTESKFELYTPGDNPAFETALNVILAEISIGTGIPREKLLGNQIGLKSSEVNQSYFYQALEKIQNYHLQDFEWLYAQIYGISDFYLEVNPYRTLNEEDTLNLKILKLNALNTASGLTDRFGIPVQTLLDWLDIDMKVDPKILAEFKERRETIINNTAGNDNNDDEQPAEQQQQPSDDDDEE